MDGWVGGWAGISQSSIVLSEGAYRRKFARNPKEISQHIRQNSVRNRQKICSDNPSILRHCNTLLTLTLAGTKGSRRATSFMRTYTPRNTRHRDITYTA